MRKIISLFVFAVGCSLAVFSQNGTVKGTITSATDNATIPSVNVTLFEKDGVGTSADIDGNYEISLEPGKHTLVFSFVGYKEMHKKVTVEAGQTITLDVAMEDANSLLPEFTKTGTAIEKHFTREPVTVEVIGKTLIENTNTVTVRDALLKAPGVFMFDDQINIRGGTGFTYGAGSRVMLVLDDQIMLTADRGDAKMQFIPMENVEQIEVLKGASSVLYGSSALNGVVHVRTAWPTMEPKNNVTIYHGVYTKPKDKYQAWWSHIPTKTGASFSHRRKYGKDKNMDLVLGGHLSSNQTHLEGEHSSNARFNFKTRIRPKDPEAIVKSYGINGINSWGLFSF